MKMYDILDKKFVRLSEYFYHKNIFGLSKNNVNLTKQQNFGIVLFSSVLLSILLFVFGISFGGSMLPLIILSYLINMSWFIYLCMISYQHYETTQRDICIDLISFDNIYGVIFTIYVASLWFLTVAFIVVTVITLSILIFYIVNVILPIKTAFILIALGLVYLSYKMMKRKD